MIICDNLLKSFSENHKQLTKINDFLLFLPFHENREGTISANFIKGYSLAILPIFSKI